MLGSANHCVNQFHTNFYQISLKGMATVTKAQLKMLELLTFCVHSLGREARWPFGTTKNLCYEYLKICVSKSFAIEWKLVGVSRDTTVQTRQSGRQSGRQSLSSGSWGHPGFPDCSVDDYTPSLFFPHLLLLLLLFYNTVPYTLRFPSFPIPLHTDSPPILLQ